MSQQPSTNSSAYFQKCNCTGIKSSFNVKQQLISRIAADFSYTHDTWNSARFSASKQSFPINNHEQHALSQFGDESVNFLVYTLLALSSIVVFQSLFGAYLRYGIVKLTTTIGGAYR